MSPISPAPFEAKKLGGTKPVYGGKKARSKRAKKTAKKAKKAKKARKTAKNGRNPRKRKSFVARLFRL